MLNNINLSHTHTSSFLHRMIDAGALLCVLAILASCSMMHDDRSDCPEGVYVKFRYDYNLQRADMFNAHVGAVRLYVYDEQGRRVMTKTEANTEWDDPLDCPCYRMHITDLTPGHYKLLALAAQNADALDNTAETGRAKFRIDDTSDVMNDLNVTLDTEPLPNDRMRYANNHGMPLDTLWHGMELTPIEVSDLRPTYDTISLVRDTKKINVTLRELDKPNRMDIADYDLRIIDRNVRLLYDNTVDETDTVVYVPHACWNTTDKTSADEPLVPDGSAAGHDDDSASSPVGRIGHADFMTSRIIWHDNPRNDAVLTITHRPTNHEVARINLPDMLSRLRRYEDTQRYTPQEFLDRGYDYQLDIFLKGDRLQYVNISISVLSWAMRVQMEELN